MGRTIQRDKDVDFDIESGENTSEEDTSNDERDSRNGFPWSWNGVLNLDGSEKGKNGIESCSNSSNSGGFGGVEDYNLELLVDRGIEHDHGKHGKQKSKSGNPRKPQKPPLPPKGPSLHAGDHRFVKELAELALRKRARVKKMNAVKKMRAGKPPSTSSYTNLSAMVITIVFFLVIILHAKTLLAGIRSASSAAVGLTASPDTTVVAGESLISIQYPANFNSSDGNGPGSHFPRLQEG
ncbi:hypothetical protein RYX36_019888 [Vicia faba]